MDAELCETDPIILGRRPLHLSPERIHAIILEVKLIGFRTAIKLREDHQKLFETLGNQEIAQQEARELEYIRSVLS